MCDTAARTLMLLSVRTLHPLAAAVMLIALGACNRRPADPRSYGSATQRLKPLTTPQPKEWTARTVYVPIYSSIYWPMDTNHQMVDLAATASIRNLSRRPIVLNS